MSKHILRGLAYAADLILRPFQRELAIVPSTAGIVVVEDDMTVTAYDPSTAGVNQAGIVRFLALVMFLSSDEGSPALDFAIAEFLAVHGVASDSPDSSIKND